MNGILAIDQGTTSSRAIIFSKSGKKLISSQLEFKQFFPKNGWVEHNPNEIWSTTIKVTKNVLLKSKKLKINIKALGITNQRETTVCWDKKTGEPVYNAIVWQDRRTEIYCKKNKKKEKLKPEIRIYSQPETITYEASIRSRIFLDTYVTMSNISKSDFYNIKFQKKPFMNLIWLSTILIAFGGFLRVLSKKN